MPKGGGSRKRKATTAGRNSFGGKVLNTVKGIFSRIFRRDKRPKGVSGRGGGKTSKRITQAGNGGR